MVSRIWNRLSLMPSALWMGAFLVPLISNQMFDGSVTDTKSLVLRLTAAIAVCGLSISRRSLRWPHFSWAEKVIFGILIILSLLNPILQGTVSWPMPLWLDRAAMIALIFVFFQFSSKDELVRSLRWPITLAAGAVGAICLVQFVLYRILAFEPSPRVFSGPFGENNMCAQFLVLAFPFTLLFRRYRGGFSVLVPIVVMTVLFLHQTRSALIGAGLVVVYLSFKSGFREVLRLFAIGLTAFVLSLGLISYQSSSGDWRDRIVDKSSSTADRKELYLETLQMIRDIPMGIGSGRFEFDSIPFLADGRFHSGEGLIYRSPHSEPLRFMAEEGLLWSGLAVVALAVLYAPVGVPLTALAFAFLPEFLFQFPLQTATSIFFFCILIAGSLIAKSRFSERPALVSSAFWPRVIVGGSGLLVLSLSLVIAISNFLAARNERIDDLVFACRMNPSNWSLCSAAAQKQIEQGETSVAKSLMKAELAVRPFNFVALRNLGIAQWRDGAREQACDIFEREQALLKSANANKDFVFSQCNVTRIKTLSELPPKEFYFDHLEWIKRI